jgi:hypothetical protein
MAYELPKVTIELAEYEDLKRRANLHENTFAKMYKTALIILFKNRFNISEASRELLHDHKIKFYIEENVAQGEPYVYIEKIK